MMDIVRAPAPRSGRRVRIASAIIALSAFTIWVATLRPAAPSIERSAILVDSVRRGDLVREVRGAGSLVSEQIRWITAQASARVERLGSESGKSVASGDVLLELSNPDLQIEALQAEQQVRQAEMALLSLRAALRGQLLTQESVVATTTTQHLLATRDAAMAESLATRQLIASFDVQSKQALREELTTRLRVERERLSLLREDMEQQLTTQRSQVEQLRAIAVSQRSRLGALSVRAPDAGVLQDLTLQVGQWVPEGTTLAKVVRPGRLKAVLRIPESQAKDVIVGQAAMVDTRNGIVRGHVTRKDPAVLGGSVTIDVALDGALPKGAVPDLTVDGTIIVEQLRDVLFTGRPVQQSIGPTVLFKLADDGRSAVRTSVELGRSSINLVEVVRGLAIGDQIIVSDLSQYAGAERLRIK